MTKNDTWIEHDEESKDCWCCPTVEKVINAAGEVVEIVIHNSKEEAN